MLTDSDIPDCELEDTYGVLVDTDETPTATPIDLGQLKLYYIAVPSIVTDLQESLLVPDFWLSAFIHYVSGMALQDDNDANNIQRGEIEFQKYQRMLVDLHKKSAKDFTSSYKSKLETNVRRI